MWLFLLAFLYSFMWQICGYIPQTILPIEPNITQKAAQLSTTFFIETFIHAKEKVKDLPDYPVLGVLTLNFVLAHYGAMGRTGNEAI